MSWLRRSAVFVAMLIVSSVLAVLLPRIVMLLALFGASAAVLGLAERAPWQRVLWRDTLLLASAIFLIAIGGAAWSSEARTGSGRAVDFPREEQRAENPREDIPTTEATTNGTCDDEQPLPEFGEEAFLEIQATLASDRSVRFEYRTNLPRGSTLMLDLRGSSFRGQSPVTIEGRCGTSERFATNGLPVGEYVISATTPSTHTQPSHVQPALGEHGALLRGPLIAERDGERFVEVSVPFSVGTAAEASGAENTRASNRIALRDRLQSLLDSGREMASLRRAGNERRCGERMRELQGEVGRGTAEAERIGDDFLHRADGSFRLCVSCSETAMEYCGYAEDALDDWASINQDWLSDR